MIYIDGPLSTKLLNKLTNDGFYLDYFWLFRIFIYFLTNLFDLTGKIDTVWNEKWVWEAKTNNVLYSV